VIATHVCLLSYACQVPFGTSIFLAASAALHCPIETMTVQCGAPCDALFVFSPPNVGEEVVDIFLLNWCDSDDTSPSGGANGDETQNQVQWFSLPAAPVLRAIPILRDRLGVRQQSTPTRIMLTAPDLAERVLSTSCHQDTSCSEARQLALASADLDTWSALLGRIYRLALARKGLIPGGLRDEMISRINMLQTQLVSLIAAGISGADLAVGHAEAMVDEVVSILVALGFSVSSAENFDTCIASSLIESVRSLLSFRTVRESTDVDKMLSRCVQVVSRLRQLVDARAPLFADTQEFSQNSAWRLAVLARALSVDSVAADALSVAMAGVGSGTANQETGRFADVAMTLLNGLGQDNAHPSSIYEVAKQKSLSVDEGKARETVNNVVAERAKDWLRGRGLLRDQDEDHGIVPNDRGSKQACVASAAFMLSPPNSWCDQSTKHPAGSAAKAEYQPHQHQQSLGTLASYLPPCVESQSVENQTEEQLSRDVEALTQSIGKRSNSIPKTYRTSKPSSARGKSPSGASTPSEISCGTGLSLGSPFDSRSLFATPSSVASTASQASRASSSRRSPSHEPRSSLSAQGESRSYTKASARLRESSSPAAADGVRNAQRRVNTSWRRWADEMKGCGLDTPSSKIARTRTEILRRRDTRIRQFMEAKLHTDEGSKLMGVAAKPVTVAAAVSSSPATVRTPSGEEFEASAVEKQGDTSGYCVDLSFLEAEAEAMRQGFCTPSPPPRQSPLPG